MDLIYHDELISSQEHPLLTNPPYNLTISINDLITPKITKNQSGIDDVPRPHNAFILFRTDFAAKLKTGDKKPTIRLISQLASSQWKKESEIVKIFFKLLAELHQQRHKEMYPEYRYTPKSSSLKSNEPNATDTETNDVKKVKRSKPLSKKDELKLKKKNRIITWYVHDNGHSRNGSSFRHTGLNISNPADTRDVFSEETSNNNNHSITFINYTTSSSNPVVFHSTTTTTAAPPNFMLNDSSLVYEYEPAQCIPQSVNIGLSPPSDIGAPSDIASEPSDIGDFNFSETSPPSDTCFWAEELPELSGINLFGDLSDFIYESNVCYQT